MDAAPGDTDREQAGRLCRLDVEGRVADVRSLFRRGTHPVEREQERLRIRFVPRSLVAADDRLEEMRDRNARERELDGLASLRGDDSQPPALLFEANEHVVHPRATGELVVQRLVVRAIDVDELVDLVRRESVHLGLETGSTHRRHQHLVGNLCAENLFRGMPHRREDDRARVDHRTVEIEEDNGKLHAIDASYSYATDVRYSPHAGAVGPASALARPSRSGAMRSGGSSSIVPTSVRTMCLRKLFAAISNSSASPRRCHSAARTFRRNA